MVWTDVFGAGEGAEVAHHTLVKGQRSRAEIAGNYLRHAVFHLQTFRTGTITAAAMTAVLRFRKGFGGIVQPVPAITNLADVVILDVLRNKVVQEADLHAFFNFSLACQCGGYFALAFFTNHAAAGTAYALTHTADIGSNRIA